MKLDRETRMTISVLARNGQSGRAIAPMLGVAEKTVRYPLSLTTRTPGRDRGHRNGRGLPPLRVSAQGGAPAILAQPAARTPDRWPASLRWYATDFDQGGPNGKSAHDPRGIVSPGRHCPTGAPAA